MASSACAVHRLTLTRFRGYGTARLDAGPGPVVLTGPNGAGKTNLLEAISFLTPGRGLRGVKLGEVEQRAPPPDGTPAGWAVAATAVGAAGPVALGTGTTGSDGKDRRLVRIDGRNARGVDLAAHLTILWLTPLMDRLFTESASGRRRFIDRLVFGFDPAHAGRVGRYEQALRERSRLLRDGCREPAWLAGLEEVLAATGVAVAAARRELVARLDAVCRSQPGPFPRAGLILEGETEAMLDQMPALAVEDRLRAALSACRRQDGESGGSAIGVHRSDLRVNYHGPSDTPGAAADPGIPAEQSSTGEQKALLLSIVLANARLLTAERRVVPILLLDEVAAHLDPSRRAALFRALLTLGCQAWMTGTEPALFLALAGQAQFFQIEAAAITPGPSVV